MLHVYCKETERQNIFFWQQIQSAYRLFLICRYKKARTSSLKVNDEQHRPDRNASKQLDILPTHIERIEAADADGIPNAFFRKLVQHQIKCGAASLGRIFARPPRSAILGKGNFGKVWRGLDVNTGQMYAVKSLDSLSSRREYEIMLKLSTSTNPFVVRVFCVHHFEDVPIVCIVMNLCMQGDLSSKILLRRELLKDQDYIHPPQAASWMRQLFLGLNYIHLSVEILHRDIKPANILMTSDDCLQLADFGLSCVASDVSRLGYSSDPIGTPGYVAPEVLLRELYDWRADIYSSGACMWVLLHGGEREQLEPAPPNSAHLMRTSHDTNVLSDDWLFLVEAIKDVLVTATGEVQAALQLTIELIARSPNVRPSHRQILASSFLV